MSEIVIERGHPSMLPFGGLAPGIDGARPRSEKTYLDIGNGRLGLSLTRTMVLPPVGRHEALI